MELTSSSIVKNLLKKYGLWAKKSLGQHFLVDKNILNKIIKAANLTKKDIVLEIGPGIGVLTKELCKRAKKVIAVEIDKKMVEILKETLKGVKNVEIVEGDILKIENLLLSEAKVLRRQSLKIDNYKVVANIPYQMTSSLLEKFLTAKNKPKKMILLVQKEVAQKICSNPPDMNRLGIFVKLYGTPKIIAFVSKNSFWPPPAVDSAILKISEIRTKQDKRDKLFLELVKRGFSQKRKQLKNIFDEKILKNAGIMPKKRAEELDIKDWVKLFNKCRYDEQNSIMRDDET